MTFVAQVEQRFLLNFNKILMFGTIAVKEKRVRRTRNSGLFYCFLKIHPIARMESFYLEVQIYSIFLLLQIFLQFSSRFKTQYRIVELELIPKYYKMGKNQFVVKHPNGWAVKGAGNERATKVTSTQKEAINVARNIAINQGSELTIQGRDGKFRQKDSYGNDNYPPKG